jgi:hypothetical protein
VGTFPAEQATKVDFPSAFEFHCEKGEIKGRVTGPTARGWRPKIILDTAGVGPTNESTMAAFNHLIFGRA